MKRIIFFLSFSIGLSQLTQPALAFDLKKVRSILQSIPESARKGNVEPRLFEEIKTAKKEEKANAIVPIPRLELRSGDLLKGQILVETLDIQTPFGVLQIPQKEYQVIEFYPEADPAILKDIVAAIKELGHSDFKKRDQATKYLEKTYPDSIKAVTQASKSDDFEVRHRALKLLDEFSNNDDSLTGLDRREIDTIKTKGLKLEGKILLDVIPLKTDYGTLNIPKRDILKIVFNANQNQETQVEIPSSKLAPSNWVPTQVEISAGDKIEISAKGTMNVSNYGVNCGPDGSTRTSRVMRGFRMLTLVGKIGKSGTPFKVGSNYKANSKQKGQLFLSIVPFRYASAVGTYVANIKVKK